MTHARESKRGVCGCAHKCRVLALLRSTPPCYVRDAVPSANVDEPTMLENLARPQLQGGTPGVRLVASPTSPDASLVAWRGSHRATTRPRASLPNVGHVVAKCTLPVLTNDAQKHTF